MAIALREMKTLTHPLLMGEEPEDLESIAKVAIALVT